MEQKKPANVDTNALVESVKNDMINVERGKQWIMSSYSPFKDKTAFPGFIDDSFDEIRLGYYDAQKTGRVDLYFQQIQTKHREAMLRVKRLQAPSPDFVSIFVQLYNTPAPVTLNTATSGYFGNTGHPANNNIFATNQHQTWGTPQTSNSSNIFGSNSNQSNPFASTFHTKAANSIFGASSNVFSKTVAQPVSGSIFGSSGAPVFGASGSSAFGGQSVFGGGSAIFGGGSNSLFGGTTTPGSTVFGAPAAQSSSIFGSGMFGTSNAVFGSSNTFGSQPVFGTQSTFGAPALSTTAPPVAVFGGTFAAPSSDIFGKTASFLNPPQASPFVATQPLFGTTAPTPATFTPSSVATSVFASTENQPMSIFGGVANLPQTFPAPKSTFNPSPFVAPASQSTLFTQQQSFPHTTATLPAPFQSADTDTVGTVPFAAVGGANVASAGAHASYNVTGVSSGNTAAPFAAVSPFINPLGGNTRAKLTPHDFVRTNPEYYSVELTDDDLAAFRNLKFEFGAIPVDPPTVDLCI